MSFACRPPGGSAFPGFNGDGSLRLNDDKATPTLAQGSFTLNTDGTISTVNAAGGKATVWYLTAPVTGIGNSFWAKLVRNSGISNTSGEALNAVLALSSSRTWGWSTTSGVLVGNFTLTIYSDAGGANQVAAATLDVDVEST